MDQNVYCDAATQNLTLYQISENKAIAVALCTASCTLSTLGAIAIFWTYYKLPEIRNFVRTLMISLTTADLITALGYFISVLRFYNKFSDMGSCELCIAQSFITTYSSLVSFLMTMVIALHIFLTVVRRSADSETLRCFTVFMAISWVVPACLVIGALSHNKLGKDLYDDDSTATGPWCWINITREKVVVDGNHKNGTGDRYVLTTSTVIWMTITGKGWEIACYLVTTTLYILVKLHMYLKHKYREFDEVHPSLRREDRNYILVFLVLYLCRVWGTARFLLATYVGVDEGVVFKILEYLQAFGDPLQAFLNFLLFCLMDKTVRTNMILSCCYAQTCEMNRHNDVIHERVRYGAMRELRSSYALSCGESYATYTPKPFSFDEEQELTVSLADCKRCEKCVVKEPDNSDCI